MEQQLRFVPHPETTLQPEVLPSDIQKVIVGEYEQQEWSSRVEQEQPEPPHIKEEQEELWTSQEGEQLQGLEEADISKLPFPPVPVKSEDDEEKPQSSQLHQSPAEESREVEPLSSSSTHHLKTEADGDHCGGPEPASNLDPDTLLHPDTEGEMSDSSETEDSETDWNDPGGKPFHCSVCRKTFKRQGYLNIHMRTHTGKKPFSCSLCGKCFTQQSGLDYHLKTHSGEKPFSCSICGKRFAQKGTLQYHMATHTGEKQFSCCVCNRRFRGKSQLKIHKCVGNQPQLPVRPLSCSECNETFPNKYLLVTHLRMHKGKKLFTCSVCGQKWQCISHLKIHMRTHTGEKPFSCSVCGKRFTQKGIMTQHMAVHSEVKPFGCNVCGKRFYWHFQIKKHKCLGGSLQKSSAVLNGQYSGSNPVGYPDTYWKTRVSCEVDDIEFWKDTRQHESGFTYQRNKKVCASDDGCEPTRKACSHGDDVKTEPKTDDDVDSDSYQQRQSDLNQLQVEKSSSSDTRRDIDNKLSSSSEDRHTLQTRMKHQAGLKLLSCSFCEKAFATGGHLTRHISVHTGKRLLRCIVCEKSFTVESQLISHECFNESLQLLQSQTGPLIPAKKTFSCSQCGKGFNRKHNLQVHMRTHTGDKPFSCSVCSKRFSKCDTLNSHMASHSGEKPFRCSVCSSEFSDSESLVKHMRIHTGQTQFNCLLCDKGFAWRRNLIKHMEAHAKKKNYKCNVCCKRFTWHYQLTYHECAGETTEFHQSQTEENQELEPLTEADGDDSGGSEPADSLDPDTPLQPDTNDELSDSPESDEDSLKETKLLQSNPLKIKGSESDLPCSNKSFKTSETFNPQSDDSVDSDFWKETQERRVNDVKNTVISDSELEHEGHQKPSESAEPVSDDSVDSDFWKDNRQRQSGLDSKIVDEVFERETGYHTLRPYSCPHCTRRFRRDCHLRNHLRTHSGETPFTCSICGQQCVYKSQLKIHMRTHTGEKPFICPVCGQRYAHKATMQSHMTVHTMAKQYSCSVCDKSFAWYTELKYHQCVGESAR